MDEGAYYREQAKLERENEIAYVEAEKEAVEAEGDYYRDNYGD